MIVIDGSHGEGGGQIFRTAIGLSAMTSTPVRIVKIRLRRPDPGLRPQHLTALKVLRDLTSGYVVGAFLGSTTVEFSPGEIRGGTYSFDIGTAGSITLVMQALMLPMTICRSPVRVRLRGGTDVKWSPTLEHFRHVFLYHLRRMGAEVEVQLVRRGYYPRGGGEVICEAVPSELSSFRPGSEIGVVEGVAFASGLPDHIPRRMALSARKVLIGIETTIKSELSDGGPGAGITLWTSGSRRLGSDALGEPGLPAEDVGARAARKILSEIRSGAEVDIYTSDQLVPYIALYGGEYTTRDLTNHASTCIWLANQFLHDAVNVEREGDLWRFRSSM